jgi:hypothetical protein
VIACRDRAGAKAAYRFPDNHRVDESAKVLAAVPPLGDMAADIRDNDPRDPWHGCI